MQKTYRPSYRCDPLHILKQRLHTATDNKRLKVAVVGSGPAGFYTTYRIASKNPDLSIDMFESLPVPFGLSRYGVAPDHPEVKNCEEKFREVATSPNFRFVGNVTVGSNELPLQRLAESYNSVVFAYGCHQDRRLGIAGEDHPGVISAREFVAWYNGYPGASHLDPPLENTEDVTIIGNGNVALDVARILGAHPERLKTSDISQHALEKLRQSSVKNICVTARRGVTESAFTTKEIRELVRDPGLMVDPIEPKFIQQYMPFVNTFKRPLKRTIQVLEKIPEENAKKSSVEKRLRLEYLLSPVEFFPSNRSDGLLEGVKFEVNNLVDKDGLSPPIAIGSSEFVTRKSELAFRSIGYQSLPLPGMEKLGICFDSKKGIILNNSGRALSANGQVIPGLYASGWVRSGPRGVIAQTMLEAFEVGDCVSEDIGNNTIDTSLKPGFEAVKDQICQPVYWSDWLKIDSEEIHKGQSLGKSREKYTSVEDMLSVL